MAGMDFGRFDYGALHETQRARLGIETQDIDGNRWGYIRVASAFEYGEVVAGSAHGELVTTDPGVVVAGGGVLGSDRLVTNNGFQRSDVTQDLRGAVGFISEGLGQSQTFYILENDDDTAKVFVLTGNNNRNENKGWAVGLDATSRFLLYLPGLGRRAGAETNIVEGVAQVDATADDVGKFCWVKRSGVTPVKPDASDIDLTLGDIVVPTIEGLVIGSTTAVRGIGRALGPTNALDDDNLVLAHLDIPTGPVSYNYAEVENGYNEVVIR